MSEAHCKSFLCTELLLFNYAKVKTVFHSMAPLNTILWKIYVANKCCSFELPAKSTMFASKI